MARSSSGKSVARAAATGGGTTYRGQMPVNWYAALVIIVIIGIGVHRRGQVQLQQDAGGGRAGRRDVVARRPGLRHLRDHGVGVAGLAVLGHDGPHHHRERGPLHRARRRPSEAGNNATLGKFADGYTGLTLTNTKLKYPSTKVPDYTNGEKCPAGTPDAGKVGIVQARSWVISTKTAKNGEEEETGGATTDKPADLKFLNRQLITTGFVPTGTQMPKPPASTILALQQVLAGGSGTGRHHHHDGRRHDIEHGAVGHDDHDGRRPPRRRLAPSTTTTKPSSTTTTK